MHTSIHVYESTYLRTSTSRQRGCIDNLSCMHPLPYIHVQMYHVVLFEMRFSDVSKFLYREISNF